MNSIIEKSKIYITYCMHIICSTGVQNKVEVSERHICQEKNEYEKITASGAAATSDPKWCWYKYLRWLDPYHSKSR